MRISFVFPLLLVLAAALIGCQEQTSGQGQAKMAVVDMARLMRDSVPGKDGVKFIESQQADMQRQLDAIQERLEKNSQDEAAMQELQRVYAASQQRIQAEGQNVVTILLDAIQRELNSFREKNGYDVIITSDAIAAFNPQIDVTNVIMGEVDKLKLDFKPLRQAAQPGEAAADDAAGKAQKPEQAPATEVSDKAAENAQAVDSKDKASQSQPEKKEEQNKK